MSSVVDLKTKEERDAALDKKIEALRKKNEALMRRYQEIEEDRKKAEQEGIAVTAPRKLKHAESEKKQNGKENLTIMVDLSSDTPDKRVINDRKPSSTLRSTPRSPIQQQGQSPQQRTSGRFGQKPPGRSPRGDRLDCPNLGSPEEEGLNWPEQTPRGDRINRSTWDGPGREGLNRSERALHGDRLDCLNLGSLEEEGLNRPERTPRGDRINRSTWDGPGREGLDRSERIPRGDRMDHQVCDSPGGEGLNWSERSGRGRRGRGRGGGGGSRSSAGGSGGSDGVGGGPHGVTAGGPDRKSKDWEEKRRQNIEKMNEEMEKIAEYERSQRDGVVDKNPIRNFLDDPRRSGPLPDGDRKEGSRRHIRNWGGPDFEKVKTGMEREKEWHVCKQTGMIPAQGRRPGPNNSCDMTLSMTGRERAEYMRWKKEREQIDQERLARHRNATGQWRREWDLEKTESMLETTAEPPPLPDQGSRREDSRRPPKPPTLGDFFAERKPRDSGRHRGQGRGREPGKSYSMHDNRWEEKSEEDTVEKTESSVGKQVPDKQTDDQQNNFETNEEDDDQWEDASEEEEEIIGESVSDDQHELEEEEGDSQQPKMSPVLSPKEKRTQKLHETPTLNISTKATEMESKETDSKPLSPFIPTEGYCPVTDWGEAMEMLSPRSSTEESPLRLDTTSREVSSGTEDSFQSENADDSVEEDGNKTAETKQAVTDTSFGENEPEKQLEFSSEDLKVFTEEVSVQQTAGALIQSEQIKAVTKPATSAADTEHPASGLEQEEECSSNNQTEGQGTESSTQPEEKREPAAAKEGTGSG